MVMVYRPTPPRMTVLVSLNGRKAKPKRGLKSFFWEKRSVSGQPAWLACRKGVQGMPLNEGPGHALIDCRNPGAVMSSACCVLGMITRPVRGTDRSKLVMSEPVSQNGGWYSQRRPYSSVRRLLTLKLSWAKKP